MMLNDDYTKELEYTYGYFPELSPAHLSFMMLLAGFDAPDPEKLNYLELGSGQGISVNIHAASAPGTYWGTDFNADHAVFANELGQASGADVMLLGESFEQLAVRDDLPEFDMITLHGIWSWVSSNNRATIIDIARRKLKPGGLLYVSYNTSPGWAAGSPLRHLLKELADSQAKGSISQKLDNSLMFVQEIIDAEAKYFNNNPEVIRNFKALQKSNKTYLAHEFLNSTWDVIPFSETARLLADAQLSFVSSSRALDRVEGVDLSEDAKKLLQQVPSRILKETVRDYFVDRRFRSDIFAKDARKLPSHVVIERLMNKKFILPYPTKYEDLSLVGQRGKVVLSETIYKPILEVLAENDFEPKSIHDLCADGRLSKLSSAECLEAVLILYGLHKVTLASDGEIRDDVLQSALKLNRIICNKAEKFLSIPALASPLTGNGVLVSELNQLFIRGLELGQLDVPKWVYSLLKRSKQHIRIDGKTIVDKLEAQAELRRRFEDFRSSRLPRLRRLGVTDVQA